MPVPRGRPAGCLRCPVMTQAELDALIEQATVDCYNDHEQITGLFTMIDEHLAVPFDTGVLGVTVTVTNIDLTIDHEIIAICRLATSPPRTPIRAINITIAKPRRPVTLSRSHASRIR